MSNINVLLPLISSVLGAICGAIARPMFDDFILRRSRTLTMVTSEPFAHVDKSMVPTEVGSLGLEGPDIIVHKYGLSNRTKRLINSGNIRIVDPLSDDTIIVSNFGYHQNVVVECENGRFSRGKIGCNVIHFEPQCMIDLVVYMNSNNKPLFVTSSDIHLRWPPFVYGYGYGYGYDILKTSNGTRLLINRKQSFSFTEWLFNKRDVS